jgi:hypothetical protein
MNDHVLKILIIDSLRTYGYIADQKIVQLIFAALTSNFGAVYFRDGSFNITEVATTNVSETILYVENESVEEFIHMNSHIKLDSTTKLSLEEMASSSGIPVNRLMGDSNSIPPEYLYILHSFFDTNLSTLVEFISQKVDFKEALPITDESDQIAEKFFIDKIRAFVESKLNV